MTNVYNLGCDRQNLTDIDKEKKTRSPKDANKRRLTWSGRQLGKKPLPILQEAVLIQPS